MALIVDASVTLPWFARNQASVYTDRIRRQARSERLHVPAIWPLEFANALRQLERRRLLSQRQVDTIVDLVEPLDIVVHHNTPAARRLVELAKGLIGSCCLNGIDPHRYLRYVLQRIATHPINRIDELLPWRVESRLASALAA